MNKYHRLLGRLTGTPLLISEDKLRVITEGVTLPLMAGTPELIDRDTDFQKMRASMEWSGSAIQKDRSLNAALIEVFDGLVSKEVSAASGITSYQYMDMQITRAIEMGKKTLVFYIDSPGGEVSGLFSLTERIRSLAKQGIHTIAFTDGMATSAAYAIAAACSEFYATPTALVGSVAAIMVHVETSVADEKVGKTYTIFRSKPSKALGDSHTPLTEEAKNFILSMLDSADKAFNNDVSLSRGLSLEKILSLAGASFMAEKALELKLIDKIVSGLPEIFNNLDTFGGSMDEVQMKAEIERLTVSEAVLKTELEKVTASISNTKAEVEAKAKAEALTEFVTLAETADSLRMQLSDWLPSLKEGKSIEVVTESLKIAAKFRNPGIQSAAKLKDSSPVDDKVAVAGEAFAKALGIGKGK